MRFAAADWVAHYARTQPAAIALRNYESGETRTWAELDARVGQIAHALVHGLGLSPGERIVNLSGGDLRHFELQFACARAGLVWAPLNFRNTASELAAMCEDLRPALMITDAVWQGLASQVAQTAAIRRTILWDRAGELDAMLDPAKPVGDHHDIDPDGALQILFTAGTTGRPKAAIITLSGIVWQALNQTQFCATSEPGCHVFLPIPLFHAGGLNSLANPVLY